jgi:DNA replication regulator DPB11
MGARCTFDLTMENTHLVIGDARTPKYKYVAKERPDVKVVLPSFIDAVRNAWMAGGLVNIAPLEEHHKAAALHGLSICLTGFSDATERAAIIQKISDHGAKYEGDLSRHTTSHLIARSATGKKYQMAPQWDIAVVSEEWLHDSAERGMSLDESYYSLNLPAQERGRGAWNRNYRPDPPSPGKRNREESAAMEAVGRRKIRRTMSSKLNNEHDAIWANITAIPAEKPRRSWNGDLPVNRSAVDETESPAAVHNIPESFHARSRSDASNKAVPKTFPKPNTPGNAFAGVSVYIHGFHDPRKVSCA